MTTQNDKEIIWNPKIIIDREGTTLEGQAALDFADKWRNQNDKAIEQLEQVILAMKEELSKIDIRGLALSEYYSGQSMMLKKFIAGIQCRVQSLKQEGK